MPGCENAGELTGMSTDPENTKFLCVIPVYNNAATLLPLVQQCRKLIQDIAVVDDGCTDTDVTSLLSDESVTVLRHERNRGKGAAILTALAFAQAQGFSHLITLDADGQHAPSDLPRFMEACRNTPSAVVVGVRDFTVRNVPSSSQFGRSFSNFWIALETGTVSADTQCGFRAYPVKLVSQLRVASRHFDFEVEILVKSLWAGLPLVEVPVSTFYAPPSERVSHFHKIRDNVRLTHLHGKLVSRRLFPWPMRRLVPTSKASAWRQVLHPGRFILSLLYESATPIRLGVSAGVGTFLAVLPIPGVHTLAILYVTTRLNLNRMMAFVIQNLFVPPFTPGLCMVVGHLILHGALLPRFPRTVQELFNCFNEWLVGALVLAPVFSVLLGFLVYKLSVLIHERHMLPRERVRGNALGFWFFRTALMLTGLRGAYGLLYIVCAYYALFDGRAITGAEAYVRRRFPVAGRFARRVAVYRLFVSQGKCLIDRHAHNVGLRTFVFDSRAVAAVTLQLGKERGGFVLLLAHVGGWQLALPFLRQVAEKRSVSLLMRDAESSEVRSYVRGDDAGFNVISPDQGPACAVEMGMRLQQGEIVSIMGDRAYGGQTTEVEFLGQSAFFPASAFAVARAAGVSVIAIFAPKTGVMSYSLEASLFEAPPRGNRHAVHDGVQAFAKRLETFTLRYPYQCFLFEDVWTRGPNGT